MPVALVIVIVAVLILVQLRTIAFEMTFSPTLETSPVSTLRLLLLWVLWSWLLWLLVLICRPWAPTVFGLVTHLETSLTTTLVALAAVMSVAVVTLGVKPVIPSLSMTTRGLLTRTLVVVSLLLLSLRLNCC